MPFFELLRRSNSASLTLENDTLVVLMDLKGAPNFQLNVAVLNREQLVYDQPTIQVKRTFLKHKDLQ
jgi:hypothetical protein